jgi:hypothetical protein
MRRNRLGACAGALLCAALLTAPAALGAPARTATLGPANLSFTWEDGPRNGLGSDVTNPLPMCTDPGFYCDDTLLKVDALGEVDIKADAEGQVRPDIDLYLYRSDAHGTAGKQVKASETPNPDEHIVATDLEPGYYLLRAAYYSGIQVTYKGTAAWKAPPVNAPPLATIAKLPSSGKASRFRRITGVATDDIGVAKVEVALLRVAGKRCSELTASGSFKRARSCAAPSKFLTANGTDSWSLKLRKALRKGSYRVFARATDLDGVVQVGFAAGSRRSFRVK